MAFTATLLSQRNPFRNAGASTLVLASQWGEPRQVGPGSPKVAMHGCQMLGKNDQLLNAAAMDCAATWELASAKQAMQATCATRLLC